MKSKRTHPFLNEGPAGGDELGGEGGGEGTEERVFGRRELHWVQRAEKT